ncbi:response regulator [Tropicibacter oceani]|uniref:Response regulator transcription factor n=1 Tax=Tropicibacter oceani TaxID=3058420 RepID=A0ABY8QN09_9RHOB|nr:response regulator transcription factor [Tropicibacter oceani]WGW06011.1 response regulator transcription factor [Tropicibacter oceani]
MANTPILIIEDDPKISTLLREALESEGFATCQASTAHAAMQLLSRCNPALVTLDIRLGEDNGLELARAIRAISKVPIIMLSGQNDVIDRVVGLEIGADDYITKPFHLREVIARVRSVLRRSNPETDAAAVPAPAPAASDGSGRLSFDGMTADLDRMELYDRDGADCGLTSGDFRLLTVFIQHPRRALSRDQLMDMTGGTEWSPLDRTIDNQVARLRKKIERDPGTPTLIKTIRGIGYKFTADVTPQARKKPG